MCLGERERDCLELFFFLQNEGSGGIYTEKVTLQQFWPYPGSTSDAYLKALLDLNWANLGVLGNL